MGVHPNVGYDKFPEQGAWLGRQVEVCFNYDTTKTLKGRIVRDDVQEPFQGIVALEDGRHVLTTECHYHPTD